MMLPPVVTSLPAPVAVYDFHEVTLTLPAAPAGNPFTDLSLTGELRPAGGPAVTVTGFCDSADGTTYRIRFMPRRTGRHEYRLQLAAPDGTHPVEGSFEAVEAGRPGLVEVDPEFPYHFRYSGSGQHYFWNSTTTYALIGVRDDQAIAAGLERLARLGVNRIRAALIPPRVSSGQQWYEPAVVTDDTFTFCVNVWPAERPDDVKDPGFDTSRFNVAHFQKYERLLRRARDLGIQVSVIPYVDGRLPGVDPFRPERAGCPDEERYYRYLVARLAAFSNVMWDVTNEWHLFRTEPWVNQMGALIRASDPYGHLISVHGHSKFPFHAAPWVSFAMYQSWDEHGGYDFLLRHRREQAATGRPLPQINEEYGYEDHYPKGWGESRVAPARSADNRRRLAWEMTMAGAYQTTGERADVPGQGGWITGRGNATMVMLEGYRHLRAFFEKLPWWRLDPAPELVEGARCLAEPGRHYVLYLASGKSATLRCVAGRYRVRAFDCCTGAWSAPRELALGATWTVPEATGDGDRAFWIEAL